jgi:phage gpG-like protein
VLERIVPLAHQDDTEGERGLVCSRDDLEDEGLIGGAVVPARQSMKLGPPPSSHTRRMMLSFVIAAVVTLTFAASASAGFTQQGEKLTGEGEVGLGLAGHSVAVSADGNTALVGGRCDSRKTFGAEEPCIGAAWVFTRTGSTWRQQGAKLTGAGEIGGGEFGESVALSADGNTALIGGRKDRAGAGAAWVFTRSGSTWTQEGPKLTPLKHSFRKSTFGESVALSEDGNTALIGGGFDRHGRGAAWVFNRTGTVWTRQSKLTASDESGRGEVGGSVALSADGNTALIGGPWDHQSVGAAWVFTRTGGAWSQQGAKLTGRCHSGQAEIARGNFGWSVALSADGNTALIGEPFCEAFDCLGPHCAFSASAYAFTRSGSAWTEQGKPFSESGESSGGFARSLALSADGNTALIGRPGECYEGTYCFAGHASEFVRSGETWTQMGEQITGTGQVASEYRTAAFGFSVALSADAKTAVIGGPRDNEGVGAAWVFVQ